MTKLIGKGAFTKAYLTDSGKVLLKSIDPIKECMSMGWFPDSELFPVIECIDCEIYEMEYFPRVSSLKSNLDHDQWQLYSDLRKLNPVMPTNKYNCHRVLHDCFDQIENEEVKEIMKEALDACANYGTDIWFEISPRNVAVKNGKLILLDCFYSVSKLNEVRGIK